MPSSTSFGRPWRKFYKSIAALGGTHAFTKFAKEYAAAGPVQFFKLRGKEAANMLSTKCPTLAPSIFSGIESRIATKLKSLKIPDNSYAGPIRTILNMLPSVDPRDYAVGSSNVAQCASAMQIGTPTNNADIPTRIFAANTGFDTFKEEIEGATVFELIKCGVSDAILGKYKSHPDDIFSEYSRVQFEGDTYASIRSRGLSEEQAHFTGAILVLYGFDNMYPDLTSIPSTEMQLTYSCITIYLVTQKMGEVLRYLRAHVTIAGCLAYIHHLLAIIKAKKKATIITDLEPIFAVAATTADEARLRIILEPIFGYYKDDATPVLSREIRRNILMLADNQNERGYNSRAFAIMIEKLITSKTTPGGTPTFPFIFTTIYDLLSTAHHTEDFSFRDDDLDPFIVSASVQFMESTGVSRDTMVDILFAGDPAITNIKTLVASPVVPSPTFNAGATDDYKKRLLAFQVSLNVTDDIPNMYGYVKSLCLYYRNDFKPTAKGVQDPAIVTSLTLFLDNKVKPVCDTLVYHLRGRSIEDVLGMFSSLVGAGDLAVFTVKTKVTFIDRLKNFVAQFLYFYGHQHVFKYMKVAIAGLHYNNTFEQSIINMSISYYLPLYLEKYNRELGSHQLEEQGVTPYTEFLDVYAYLNTQKIHMATMIKKQLSKLRRLHNCCRVLISNSFDFLVVINVIFQAQFFNQSMLGVEYVMLVSLWRRFHNPAYDAARTITAAAAVAKTGAETVAAAAATAHATAPTVLTYSALTTATTDLTTKNKDHQTAMYAEAIESISFDNFTPDLPSFCIFNLIFLCRYYHRVFRKDIKYYAHLYTCWICGGDLAGTKIECEHVLGIRLIFLLVPSNVLERIFGDHKLEYLWSHQCCNQVKGDTRLITDKGPRGSPYRINIQALHTLWKKIMKRSPPSHVNCATIATILDDRDTNHTKSITKPGGTYKVPVYALNHLSLVTSKLNNEIRKAAAEMTKIRAITTVRLHSYFAKFMLICATINGSACSDYMGGGGMFEKLCEYLMGENTKNIFGPIISTIMKDNTLFTSVIKYTKGNKLLPDQKEFFMLTSRQTLTEILNGPIFSEVDGVIDLNVHITKDEGLQYINEFLKRFIKFYEASVTLKSSTYSDINDTEEDDTPLIDVEKMVYVHSPSILGLLIELFPEEHSLCKDGLIDPFNTLFENAFSKFLKDTDNSEENTDFDTLISKLDSFKTPPQQSPIPFAPNDSHKEFAEDIISEIDRIVRETIDYPLLFGMPETYTIVEKNMIFLIIILNYRYHECRFEDPTISSIFTTYITKAIDTIQIEGVKKIKFDFTSLPSSSENPLSKQQDVGIGHLGRLITPPRQTQSEISDDVYNASTLERKEKGSMILGTVGYMGGKRRSKNKKQYKHRSVKKHPRTRKRRVKRQQTYRVNI